jgi:hypothetical protein
MRRRCNIATSASTPHCMVNGSRVFLAQRRETSVWGTSDNRQGPSVRRHTMFRTGAGQGSAMVAPSHTSLCGSCAELYMRPRFLSASYLFNGGGCRIIVFTRTRLTCPSHRRVGRRREARRLRSGSTKQARRPRSGHRMECRRSRDSRRSRRSRTVLRARPRTPRTRRSGSCGHGHAWRDGWRHGYPRWVERPPEQP